MTSRRRISSVLAEACEEFSRMPDRRRQKVIIVAKRDDFCESREKGSVGVFVVKLVEIEHEFAEGLTGLSSVRKRATLADQSLGDFHGRYLVVGRDLSEQAAVSTFAVGRGRTTVLVERG